MLAFVKEWALVIGIIMMLFSSLSATAAFVFWVARFFRRHAHDIFCTACGSLSYVKKGKKNNFMFYDVYIVCLNAKCGEYKKPLCITCRDLAFDGALSFGYRSKYFFRVDALREKLFRVGKRCSEFLSPFL